MIAITKAAPKTKCGSNWHAGFLSMMPTIAKYARRAFHYLDAEAQAEAVQEILVSAMLAYFRLYQREKVDQAYPTVLARFAIAQYRSGRRVGKKKNCRDVLSPDARRLKGIHVESIHGFDCVGQPWHDVLVEDKNAGPADTAAARIDVAKWFASLKRRDRKIAQALSLGSTTKDVAKHFRISPARVSQKRREFLESWQRFQGELITPAEENLVAHPS